MGSGSLSKKLRFQVGQHALLLNAPEGYLVLLGDLPDGVKIEMQPGGMYDSVHLYVKDSHELRGLRSVAIDAFRCDGVFWISYPKGSSKVKTALTRDFLWEFVGDTGLSPVARVSVHDVWSAMRFRPIEQVGT